MPDNEQQEHLPHTRGGTTTKDATDQGVPMAPGEGPEGPEDAMDPDAQTRGDYAGRRGEGISYESRVVGHRDDGSPIIERVRQR
jgi:hypothetical protein